MNQNSIDALAKASEQFDKAVETLATGVGHIQQRLAEAATRSRLDEKSSLNPALPPDVYALQQDLLAAMNTAQDSERGSAAASAGALTDDQCTILGRRILTASRTLSELVRSQSPQTDGSEG